MTSPQPLYLLLLILILSSCGADNTAKKGDKFYAIGEYYEAALLYQKAYKQTSPKDKERTAEHGRLLR